MAFCIPKHIVDKFIKDLKAGKINFDQLIDMTSPDRRNYFAGYFGETNADKTNALFERKIMLTYQKKGIIDWIKTVANMKPEVKRDIISRVNRMEKILDPKNDMFLEDLAAQRLGVTVTMEEAANISSLAQIVAANEQVMENSERRTEYGKPTEPEMNYGASVVAFEKYLEALKSDKRTGLQKAYDYITNPLDLISLIGGSAKAIVASIDDSFIGRQGIRLFYHGVTGDVAAGRTWVRTFFKSFGMIYNTFRNKPVLDTIRAEILSDPDYNLMRKAKVATATIEEEFPVHWPSRIPIVGKGFKASEVAFTGSAYYMRYRTAKAYFDIARKSGVDLSDKTELESIGKLVNSLTARGDTGPGNQKSGIVNSVIWSPKMIKANFDVLTMHRLDKKMSKFAKKQAAISLLRIIVGQAMVLAIAHAIWPESVEWDPRSSNFGKIRIGTTRFDISGGMAPFVTLASRIAPIFIGRTPKTKSSVTGEIKELNKGGYFNKNALDVLVDFFENKTAPAATVVKDYLKGETFQGEKPSLKSTAVTLGVPITTATYKELKDDPESANIIVGMFAEAIGISAQTYDHISTWTEAELRKEIRENTYQKPYKRKGRRLPHPAGHPHQGRDEYVKVLRKELRKR